jgi:hypothetical protein
MFPKAVKKIASNPKSSIQSLSFFRCRFVEAQASRALEEHFQLWPPVCSEYVKAPPAITNFDFVGN